MDNTSNFYGNKYKLRSALEYIKIENFRSIKMVDSVQIMPITILVGKNSAGKSTFARSFPLIRQSTEAKKRAPILWFGDRVDFGSFDESLIRTSTKEREMIFTFGLNISGYVEPLFSLRKNSTEDIGKIKAEVRLGIQKSGNDPSQASAIGIKAFGYEVLIELGTQNSITHIDIEDHKWIPKSDAYAVASYGAILPNFTILKRKNLEERANNKLGGEYVHDTPFGDDIQNSFKDRKFALHKKAILTLIENVPLLQKGKLADYIISQIEGASTEKINAIKIRSIRDRITKIEPLVFASKVNSLIDILNNSLKNYYAGVKYIEPLRATAVRYYRRQELAIDEIDSKGENLAMFLDNLAPYEIRNFNDWTTKRFGFSARAKKDGNHVAIVIQEAGSENTSNLADIGFGFSQILPVITQIWHSTTSRRLARRSNCIIIEQPELHLHPAFQAKLADVFAAAVSSDANLAQNFIIETHSNHIINRLGQLISENKLDSRAVQILIFEKNADSITEIRRANFDEDGYLINWPLGFFEPEA